MDGAQNRRRKRRMKRFLRIILMFCLCASAYLSFRYQNTSVRRLKNQYESTISFSVCDSDMDQDGMDDQSDILYSAFEYLNTEPKYKSRYYEGGYPDDGYGVCTDVVAFALKNAGYDLRQLVNDDILAHPKEYDISVIDSNIDFRRVRNLTVYFSHTALKCTDDLAMIEEWQGGDIVIFRNHIGIISDRRNSRGVPYLIHHSGPFQYAYEEDVLEQRDDLTGHYRIYPYSPAD